MQGSMVEQAAQFARDLMEEEGWGSLPVDVNRLAMRLGVRSIEPKPMPYDGYLAVTPAGLAIRYNSGLGEKRTRFTIAHELGHVLIARMEGELVREVRFRGWKRDNVEERAANRVAAELLMPHDYVRARLRRGDAIWRTLRSLARQLNVSDMAIALRLLEIDGLVSLILRTERTAAGLEVKCSSVSSPRVLLSSRPAALGKRVENESTYTNLHDIEITYARRTHTLSCEGRFLRGRYWVVGWES